MTEKNIYTWECWTSGQPQLMGILWTETLRGKETCSFEFVPQWLKVHSDLRFLDPDLAPYCGRQHAPVAKKLFGLFSDTCPDRWGRHLMDRMERIVADREHRSPRHLIETDYLLGVYDSVRMGSLRFSLQKEGPFLGCGQELAMPPWSALRDLEVASLAFEEDKDPFSTRWLSQLLAPGSALGGARPKVTVQAADGSLWIAKFPSQHDERNSGAWEQTVHELAKACGLNVPGSHLLRFSDAGSTYLVKRFDRDGKGRDGGQRIHFASAMCLLGQTDGCADSSYLDLADFITRAGASPREDLSELWQRIVFSMAVTNTDDHLRNHGFLLTPKGWRLSPLYDVNPDPRGNKLSLNVAPDDPRIHIDLALEVAPFFGLTPEEAEGMARKILNTVRNEWRRTATGCGLSRAEQEEMAPAFRICGGR